MLTCVIRYDIDPNRRDLFETYARTWGQCIPRNGAQLLGYFSPREGSVSQAYGIYNIDSLAAYEVYRARLAQDPLGKQNFDFARSEGFIRQEERSWLARVDQP